MHAAQVDGRKTSNLRDWRRNLRMATATASSWACRTRRADTMTRVSSWGSSRPKLRIWLCLERNAWPLHRRTWQPFGGWAHPESTPSRQSSAPDGSSSSWNRPRPKLATCENGVGTHSTMACRTHLGPAASSSSAARPPSWTIPNYAPSPVKRPRTNRRIATSSSSWRSPKLAATVMETCLFRIRVAGCRDEAPSWRAHGRNAGRSLGPMIGRSVHGEPAGARPNRWCTDRIGLPLPDRQGEVGWRGEADRPGPSPQGSPTADLRVESVDSISQILEPTLGVDVEAVEYLHGVVIGVL